MVGMTRDSMVSVVVPLCNEEANLPELRARLTAALAHHEFECILVDDGSTDATSAMIRDVAREDPRFKVVSLSRNFGHQAAIRVVDLIVAISERHPYVRGLRSWVGFRQVAFPYERDRRHRGRPKYTVWKLLDLAVSGIVPFSVVPLRLVALSGAAISALALAAGLGVLLGWMPFVAGVVAALAFLFGLQLLIIGLLGEYVGRVLEEVQNRPIFVVDEVVGVDPAQATGDRRRGAPRTS
ncbi:MAG: hypothetical protein DME14_17690 [Candidatus Rokuibacteriota bacterium]|nr:MAG: hypothetical protein DME14_17690 [Candidatus Rokubacteria bacterium]